MTTEGRSPRSRCRGCSPKTRIRVHHRRNHHQRPSCRCLSIVPPWEREGAVKARAGAEMARAAAARARAAAECGYAECGCAPEEAERGKGRTRHGNLSALGHRNCTGWGSLRNRCTVHMCHHYRARHCSRYCRRSWGCGSAGSGCAHEARSPSSRCRDCRKPTHFRVRRHRSHCQRRRRTCLCIVPPRESGCAECGCAECGCAESADGGHVESADGGHAESADGGHGR
jgi:hypothetical protein